LFGRLLYPQIGTGINLVTYQTFFSANILLSASVYNSFAGTNRLILASRYTNTFDANKNVLRKINLPYPTANGITSGIVAGLASGISLSNILTQAYVERPLSGGRSTLATNRAYTYNSDGYPTITRYTGYGGTKQKDIFFYRTL
jgi:hypothetical protein